MYATDVVILVSSFEVNRLSVNHDRKAGLKFVPSGSVRWGIGVNNETYICCFKTGRGGTRSCWNPVWLRGLGLGISEKAPESDRASTRKVLPNTEIFLADNNYSSRSQPSTARYNSGDAFLEAETRLGPPERCAINDSEWLVEKLHEKMRETVTITDGESKCDAGGKYNTSGRRGGLGLWGVDHVKFETLLLESKPDQTFRSVNPVFDAEIDLQEFINPKTYSYSYLTRI
ncbi:hypothetical protein C8R44DRAFT_733069 [Mycena epipterygia]|nr:hypothetical protein C8R44DRAFT_733069 [Mycena epipterygia]